MKNPLLMLLDTFFRLTASDFTILPPEAGGNSSGTPSAAQCSETSDDINLGFLRSFSREDIVAALRELSFKDTLLLLSSLSTPSRQHILNALDDFHDLKAALQFALDFGTGDDLSQKPATQDYPIERLAIKFLKHLSEHSTATPQLFPESVAETHCYGALGTRGKPLPHTG